MGSHTQNSNPTSHRMWMNLAPGVPVALGFFLPKVFLWPLSSRGSEMSGTQDVSEI